MTLEILALNLTLQLICHDVLICWSCITTYLLIGLVLCLAWVMVELRISRLVNIRRSLWNYILGLHLIVWGLNFRTCSFITLTCCLGHIDHWLVLNTLKLLATRRLRVIAKIVQKRVWHWIMLLMHIVIRCLNVWLVRL